MDPIFTVGSGVCIGDTVDQMLGRAVRSSPNAA